MNPVSALIEAYLKGRNWQLKRLDKQNEMLERIAKALEEIAKK